MEDLTYTQSTLSLVCDPFLKHDTTTVSFCFLQQHEAELCIVAVGNELPKNQKVC
jgi:hypothetical protein